ncbi:MAG: response regulator [Lachnospiraceae bacterium]|nr:response regulator [Lachnospiraceae bacterium]
MMNKKVLLVGMASASTMAIKEFLAKKFNVKICSMDARTVEGMLKMVNPDMILINMNGTGNLADVYEHLIKLDASIPIVCVGKKEDYDKYAGYLETLGAIVNTDSVVDNNLMKSVTTSMGLDFSEVMKERVPNKGAGNRYTILVIDDSPLFLRRAKDMLEDHFDVELATSARRGMIVLERTHPDMILLDYEMPDVDGKEAYRMIKADPNNEDIPIVFLTGVTDKDDITEVLKLKPAGYILKSSGKDALIDRIKELLQ